MLGQRRAEKEAEKEPRPPPPDLPYLFVLSYTVHGVLTPRSNSPLYGKEIKPVSPKGNQS